MKTYADQQTADDDVLEGLVAEVTDEFLRRVERGEDPDVEEYARKHPECAEMIRQILSAVRVMRRDASSGDETSPPGSRDAVNIGGELGDFRIIREIGRGGMGVVYEAEQISLKRRVALKVLPFAAALDAKRLERFRNEAQAAARLHHAHIVPVHSVGCERGVYYFAMQFIEGESLAEVIGEFRRLNGDDDRDRHDPGSHVISMLAPTQTDSLSDGDAENEFEVDTPPAAAVKTRTGGVLSTAHSATATPDYVRFAAELGIQAAEALDHAHSFDIVHRDVKPANLMIDARGHLWITDFGLARVRDETGVTVSGDFVGTFLYSSPEQVLGHRGGVDCRTDVYSLGATLYELLTLHPAVRARRRETIVQEIAHEEPVPPRQHNRRIPVDLETILLKALAKDPVQRYQTAHDLADDLRRFLDSRPILARRPTLVERATKWTRRHRAVVVSTVLLLFVAVVGLSVATVMIAREQGKTQRAFELLAVKQRMTAEALNDVKEQRALARQQQRLADKQRRLAERNFQQARGMLDFFMQVAEEDLANRPELSDLRSRMLQVSLEYYQNFIEQSSTNPPLQAELAASHQHVARILNEIGSTPAALAALEQALQTQERLVRENPEDEELRGNLLSMYFQLGVYRGGSQFILLTHSSVQKHLKLTADQTAQIEAVIERRRGGFDEFRGKAGITEARQQWQQLAEDTYTEMSTVLTEQQVDRLNQISLQRRGPHALSDPKVAREIGLTVAQMVEIRAIHKEARELMSKCYRQSKPDDARTKLASYRITQLLTSEQQQQWGKLTGEPFEFGSRRGWPHTYPSRNRGGRRGPDRDRRDDGAQHASKPPIEQD